MTKKQKYLIKLKAVSFAAKLGVIAGVIMFAGGVGSVDFAVEAGEVLSGSQEAVCYLISLTGIPVVILCGYVVNWCEDTFTYMTHRRRR